MNGVSTEANRRTLYLQQKEAFMELMPVRRRPVEWVHQTVKRCLSLCVKTSFKKFFSQSKHFTRNFASTMSQVDLKERLNENLEYLKKNTLRLKMLVSELVSCDLLTFDQADSILEQGNHLSMHEKLYTFLMEGSSSSSQAAFAKLLKALRASGNGHLAEKLEK